jgi:glutamine amidotransferase
MPEPRVAIVDYGMGNLFSVKNACARVGLDATITSDRDAVLAADAAILPGVGAYGEAMRTLREHGLDAAIREVVARGSPFLGVCLGQQLLMEESLEFGRHEGLGIVPGSVVRFDKPSSLGHALKVPQVGWNRVRRPPGAAGDAWRGTFLDSVADGEYVYFVHSYYTRPKDPSVVAGVTRYGDVEFASALRRRNVMACQFHPERSGPPGLKIYENFARIVRKEG